MKRGLWVIACVLVAGTVSAETIRVCTWNAEGGGESDFTTLAERLIRAPEADFWVISEVRDRSRSLELKWGIETGSGRSYDYVLTRGGWGQKVLILFDNAKYDIVERNELDDLNDGRHRPPFVTRVRNLATDRVFLLVGIHLTRQKSSLRMDQSKGLNEWARKQTLPFFMTGTFNYDWKVSEGDRKHDDGYDHLTKDDPLTWIRPRVMVRTHHATTNDIQDFFFAGNLPEGASATSEVIVEPGDFPDNEETSDHRILLSVVEMP